VEDLYEILEVHPRASAEVIKKAYHTLARKYHPDCVPPDKREWAADMMRRLNRAFAILYDSAKRAQYDSQREVVPPTPARPAPPTRVAAGPGDFCAFHIGRRATGRCDRCHRLLCAPCIHEVGASTLCASCLALDEATRQMAQGQKMLASGAYYEASKAFREVLRFTPDDSGAHYNLGLALLGLKMNDEAVKSLARAAELQPMSAEVQFAYARALAAKGNYEEAIKAYRRGLSVAPEQTKAAYDLAMLLARVKAYREAYAAFDEVAKREPGNARACLMQAKMLAYLGRERDAGRALDKALGLHPGLAGELQSFPLGFRLRRLLRRLRLMR